MVEKHILLSVVVISHGQGKFVALLLESMRVYLGKDFPVEIIILENLSGQQFNIPEGFPFPTELIVNPQPQGLSANLNQAFQFARGEYYCTVNPDIIFMSSVFDSLIEKMKAMSIDIIAPLILDDEQRIQDSFRSVPTPGELLFRYIGKKGSLLSLPEGVNTMYPDWLAGMFLLMRKETFRNLSGFDEKFYLYYEDVDFCCRAALAGYVVALDVETSVIHNAQRKSHKSIRFFIMHITSTLKFLFSPVYREIRKGGKNKFSL